MTDADFTEVMKSVQEAASVLRGERKAAREFVIEVPPASAVPSSGYAICVRTDDATLLTPRKIYPVTFSASGLVSVRDEQGETSLYPRDFFVAIALPNEIERVLEYVAA
jgi:hypothetical protein